MPQIQAYDDHIAAQGGIAAQANPNSFGAQIGQATQQLGGTVQEAGLQGAQYNQTQDVTNVHVNMAKARAEWTKTFQDRSNEAQPGDENFAPQVMKDMEDYFKKFGESVQSPRGKQLFASMSASMTSEFGVRAIGVQGELAAKDAVNKYDILSKSSGSTAYMDPTQTDAAIKAGKDAIDDPNGMFGKIPQPARDKFKQQLEQDVKFAAASGYVEKNPKALLGSIAPDMLKQFDPAGNTIQANTAPGGRAIISDKAKQWAPQVQAAAAAKGLNSNILLAQIDAESGGNPNAVGPATKYGTAKGLTQFIDSTAAQYGVDVKNPQSAIAGQAAMMSDMLKKYGGDYSKALAAYNWGPGNVDKTLQRYGNDWKNHLPDETSSYVATIMAKSGSVAPIPNVSNPMPDAATGQAPVDTTQRVPVKSSLPFMNGLSWEQQNHLVNKGVQLMHTQMTMEHQAQVRAEHALKLQREATTSQFTTRILDPDNNGGQPTAAEIANDRLLTAPEKQNLIHFQSARLHELAAGIESKTNPAEVRQLRLAIHAPTNDPTKIYSDAPVLESYRLGKISSTELTGLLKEVADLKGDGSSFASQVHQAREVVNSSFLRSIEGTLNPSKAASAAYTFGRELDAKILELRKAGKDPSVLLTPGNRDYMLTPEKLNSYGMTVNYSASTQANTQTSQSMASQATKVVQAAANDRTPASGFDVGKTYTVNGKQRTYQGGPTNVSTSWK